MKISWLLFKYLTIFFKLGLANIWLHFDVIQDIEKTKCRPSKTLDILIPGITDWFGIVLLLVSTLDSVSESQNNDGVL